MPSILVIKFFWTSLDILNDVAPWLLASFLMAGLLRQFLNPDKFQKALGNRGLFAIIKATLSGMLLPICSCGVIPLGLGMYYTGAYLGPTLAFMVATPIINPAAILLAYGLLGPQIASIYLVSGFIVPVVIGIIGNYFAGTELHAPGIYQNSQRIELESDSKVGIRQKIAAGIHWGFMDLGVMVSKYIVLGVALAGLIIALTPQYIIQRYLGAPGIISITGIAVIGSVIYVCAVGHIPFVAALVASGAAPGIAITFLMTGAATNLPELISIFKMIGRRAVIIYVLTVITISMFIGWCTNKWLLPDFVPFYNLDKTKETIGWANRLIVSIPESLQYLCSIIIIGLFLYAYRQQIGRFYKRAEIG